MRELTCFTVLVVEHFDSKCQSSIKKIMILMMSMFGTAMPTLLSFPEERPVFLREYSTNHYGVVAYFISRLAMEALVTFLQILVLVRMFLLDTACRSI